MVESIPEGLTYNTSVKHTSTYDGWLELLDLAQETIEIGSFYWMLQDDTFDRNLTKDVSSWRMPDAAFRQEKFKPILFNKDYFCRGRTFSKN